MLPAAISPQYANGHHSSSNDSADKPQIPVVQNGLSETHMDDEIDNDDGQWSDWEHESDPPDSSIDVTQTLSLPPPTQEEPLTPKPISPPVKSLKLNNISKPKWNPNAPLGSEYEIPPVVVIKRQSTTEETLTNQDTDDFFRDMAPKVETVELMRQLETMFNVGTDQPNEQTQPTISRTTTAASSKFSNKFGIMSEGHDGNQESASGNNNWDE